MPRIGRSKGSNEILWHMLLRWRKIINLTLMQQCHLCLSNTMQSRANSFLAKVNEMINSSVYGFGCPFLQLMSPNYSLERDVVPGSSLWLFGHHFWVVLFGCCTDSAFAPHKYSEENPLPRTSGKFCKIIQTGKSKALIQYVLLNSLFL